MRILKKTFKKSVSILLTLTMMFGILTIIPIEANAASGIVYFERSWNGSKVVSQTKTCTDYTLLANRSSDTLYSGWYVVDRDMTIDDRLRVSGTVNLILCDKTTLTLKAGITVLENDTLNIYGQTSNKKDEMGKIYSHPQDGKGALEDHAVIGGTEDDPNAGTIVIHGGFLDLYSATNDPLGFDGRAACIGGGYKGTVKSVKIFNGFVECDGNGGGAGIGGGRHGAPSNGDGILIYGGKVKAESHGDGAAIGGGYDSPHASGTIRIYGGDITAKHCDGAGIGSGAKTDSNNIVITGGKITTCENAALADGAGIGSGKGGRAHGISISNTVIVSTTTYGAAIGSGEKGPANSIHISNSDITATSKTGGAGIGSGKGGDCEEIVLENSIIKANSKNHKDADQWIKALSTMAGSTSIKNSGYATEARSLGGVDYARAAIAALGAIIYFSSTSSSGAAIGGGNGGNAKSITIKGCDVNVKSGNYSAAIGSGDEAEGTTSITIEDSLVRTKTEKDTPDGEEMTSGTDAAAIGSGNQADVDKIRIVNSSVDVKSEGFAAAVGSGDEGSFNSIEIINCSNFKATSGDYGAAIGSGDEAEKCGTITITNSNVTAKSGTEAAAIGTGNETDQSATINITDSTVTAHGGSLAAGIGGGDDVSGGTINLTNSSITANGGRKGAGIGGGESCGGGTITIKNSNVTAHGGSYAAGIGGAINGSGGTITITNSDVTAHGGGYAAGIGGGDSANGGTVRISGSIVNAYGGTDAAGIGGGEDGNGGKIYISDGSKVYAKGKDYGAGIGGGEDASGEYCEIDSDCTVEAISGGEGNVMSIGHGDCGWYVSEYTGGTLSLGSRLKVKANGNVYTGSARFNAVWNNKSVKIYSCEHNDLEKCAEDALTHVSFCKDCGTRIGIHEEHKWNNDNICTVCGVSKEQCMLHIVERNNSSEVRYDIETLSRSGTKLPECQNIPDGYCFSCWVSSEGVFYLPGESYKEPFGTTLTAKYLKLVETKYIDEDGKEKTVMAGRIENGDSAFCSGWYVLDSSFTVNKLNTNNHKLKLKGDVALILADGAELKVEHDAWNEFTINPQTNDTVLNIFGQENQTGILDFNGSDASFHYLNQYGGTLRSYDNALKGRLEITGLYNMVRGSSYFAEADMKQLDYKGGSAYFAKLKVTEKAALSWTDVENDSFRGQLINSTNASFTIAGDLYFIDKNNGKTYHGTLSSDDITKLHSQSYILKPYFDHHFGTPEWVWSEDYQDAKAVFHCTDDGCGYIHEIRAKVSSFDYPAYTYYEAKCTFLKNTYTDGKEIYKTWQPESEITGNGTVTFDKVEAKAGETVSFTATPDSGYVIKSLKVVDKDGDPIQFKNNRFEMFVGGATVQAVFVPTGNNPRKEPYINENGEYIPGNIAYYADDKGICYGLNSDGSVNMNNILDDVSLSYFEFTLQSDGTYAITKCTKNYKSGGELVFPKTYQGRKITVIGGSSYLFDTSYGKNDPLTLVLNKNITEIKKGTFARPNAWIEKITGNTSSLKTIGDYAFMGKGEGQSIDIKLEYNGKVTIGTQIFRRVPNVSIHLSHKTTLSNTSFGATNVTYDFIDGHIYNAVWNWAEDHSSATATLTCSNSICDHQETVNATVSKSEEISKTVYTAVVEIEGKTYTDSKEIAKPVYDLTIENSEHGTVKAIKNSAYAGEEVTLTVTPDTGYSLTALKVKDGNNNNITVTDNKFIMPSGNITINAVFAVQTANILVGGQRITSVNSSDILGNGTASYDFDTNTLTLTNADIEVTGGFGIRYNESSDKSFKIVLNGKNRIAEVKDNGSGTCYGMVLYAAAPGFIISGNGTLDIEMDSDNPRCGIHARKALTVSGVKVNVNVTGSENANGVELVYNDSVLNLENGTRMDIHSGGIALQSNRNVRNLNVGDNCIFEAISDTQAVNRNINLTEGHPTVKVSADLSESAPFSWDEKTSLTSYKYISMRGINAPCTVIWMIDDEVVETDTVSYGEMPQYNGSTPKKKADTLYTYTFKGWTPEVTAAEGDATYMAVFESKEKEYQDGYNLTITDSIDVNIYLDIKTYFGGEDFTDQARVVLTYIDCNSEKPKTITEVIYLNKAELENGMFIKTITPAFAQIGENIRVKLYGNDGEFITLANGKTEYNISVADYCKTLIHAGIYDENIVKIAQAVLNYGKAASDYFKYTGAVIDGAEIVELVDYNAIPILNRFTAGSTIEKMSSSTFRAISCTELKLYITGDASGVTITKATLAGTGNIKNDCKIEKGSDGRYFVRVSNLYAYELDKEITINFSDGSVKHFSVFDYIRSILKNSNSDTLKHMVSALYQYNRAVVDFG